MATIRDSIIKAASSVAGRPVKAGPTITDALDALTDALAGRDVAGGKTIAEAFAILGEHLEDNAPSGKITISENGTDINVAAYATADVSVSGGGGLDIGRLGTVELTVNQSYDNIDASLIVLTERDGDSIAAVSVTPDTPTPSFAKGVYVMGALFNGVPVSGTYKVGDSGTPAPVDIFQSESHGETFTVFGFVMPDPTEDDLGIFVDITMSNDGTNA